MGLFAQSSSKRGIGRTVPKMKEMRHRMLGQSGPAVAAATLAIVLLTGMSAPSAAATPAWSTRVSSLTTDAQKPIAYYSGLAVYAPASSGIGGHVIPPAGIWKASGVTSSYQWYRDGKKIPGDTQIAHTLVAADKNKKLHVVVTGKKAGYKQTDVILKPATFNFELTMSGGPTITVVGGTPFVGLPLHARADYISIPNTGGWPTLDRVSYQWKRNGQPIKGAIESSYILTLADVGKKITVTTQPVVRGFTIKPATSAPTREVVDLNVVNFSKPKISGVAKVGEKLVATKGEWNAAAKTYTYQWRANGTAIKGATASSYKVAGTMAGKKISVAVTASGTHSSATVTSPATAAVRK